jgi:hypothetical protein
VAPRLRVWHGPPMRDSSTRAGGCFLTGCILGGFGVGAAIGNAMQGVLIGSAIGIAIAVGIWLYDRKRRAP